MNKIIKNKYLSEIYTNILEAVPNDHSRQVVAEDMIEHVIRHEKIDKLLDLGCGAGRSLDLFKNYPKIKWVGLDIEISPEVDSRAREDGEFHTYDGVNIPFADNSYDMVISVQALEHTKYPREVFREVYRILKPGGYFVGSTSHLEPYHSYSFFNYTPYAFKELMNEAGLNLKEIRPGIDAYTLITRKLFKNSKFFLRFWKRDTPFNNLIRLEGWLRRRSHAEINLAKLVFCGQFSFLVKKPG